MKRFRILQTNDRNSQQSSSDVFGTRIFTIRKKVNFVPALIRTRKKVNFVPAFFRNRVFIS